MIMKNLYILVSIFALSAYLCSCNRNTIPSNSDGIALKAFDTATFDFIYTEGIRQKLMGNAGDALKYFEKCIQMNAGSDAAYNQMAQISLQLGNTGSAKKFGILAAQIDEKNLWYMTFLGGIYYQEKNLDSAAIYFNKAVNTRPDNYNIKLTLANIYTEKGDLKKANDLYSEVEKVYGANEDFSLIMVKNLINSGDIDNAKIRVEGFLKQNPDDIFYNGILAEIYRKKGENEKAVEIYNKLLEIDASNPQTFLSLSDFMIAEKQYDELLVLLSSIAIDERVTLESKITLLGKVIDSEDLVREKGADLDAILKIFEDTEKNKDVIPLLRPELYVKMGRIDDAIGRYEEIIQNNPNIYFAWEKLLILYSESGNVDKLYTIGKECATRFNRSFIAKILYASGATEKKLYDEALEELRKARILAGDQKDMLLQVTTMEADIYYRLGNYNKSFDLFKKALAMNPDDIILLNNYAYYLAEQNRDLKEAEKMILKVVEKEKLNNTFLDTYAWVLYKQGKTRDAIKVMEDIMQRDNTPDADWYEHYGYMMKAVRKCDVAINYWKKSLELEPERNGLINAIESCKK